MLQSARLTRNSQPKFLATFHFAIEDFAAGKALNNKLLDQIGRKILDAVQRDARISLAELGRAVGLSAPAVAERVRRMEDEGIITGYHAAVNLQEIGLAVTAFVRLNTPPEKYARVIALANKLPEILECHHVNGSDSFIMKIAVPYVSNIEDVINQLSAYGSTVTAIVLSSPVDKHEVQGVYEEG